MGTALNVLIVDDDVNQLQTRSRLLEAEGHNVIYAADGIAALVHLESGQHFDVMVCDLLMPGLDGPSLIQSIKGMPSRKGMKIIVATGLPAQDTSGLDLGGATILYKPFDPDDLSRLLETIAAEKAANTAQQAT